MKATNDNKQQPLYKLLASATAIKWILIATGIVVVLVVAIAIAYMGRDNKIGIVSNDKIDITPTQITSIESIGKWEFLSINDEEIVDTVRHGLFGDDKLVRIYYGTLSIGVDLGKARKGWIKQQGDSIVVQLPDVQLLDEEFIDESRTRPFIETGKWKDADRQAMTAKAYSMMKERCVTRDNLETARQNATEQFKKLMDSMGFSKVHIQFEASGKK